MAEKKCAWYAEFEGVCTNFDCPRCADLCPVDGECGICRYEKEAVTKGKMPEYAEWLEGFVKRLLQEPESVNGIAVIIVRCDNAVETGYFRCSMTDKILVAGIIQQDAMLQTLAINDEDDEEEDE